MNESIIISEQVRQQFSARATLVGLGVKVRRLSVLEPMEQQVKIAQKTVKYTPLDKLTDGLIAILAGAHGLVEINKRVRPDAALQAAFGRASCAEQSVVQDTLDACTDENVKQMQTAVDHIYCFQSQGYRHAYQQRLQLLDIDTDGLPCGKKAAFATKGYFARRPNRRGRTELVPESLVSPDKKAEPFCLGSALSSDGETWLIFPATQRLSAPRLSGACC
jgi:hypothetical protein